jgi:hypothetical protein
MPFGSPRGYGEHDTGHVWLNLGIGTPPRVREALLGDMREILGCWITPGLREWAQIAPCCKS